MFTTLIQHPSQIPNPRSVQFQFCNGSSTYFRNPLDFLVRIYPPEVLFPFVFSGVVQGDFLLGLGINGLGMGIFSSVAALTRKGKVFG